ncbi:hypothetical protein L6452_28412 [Arctium lappa]|uniref:Uncharacterized protein n=1 Tax=Arctium lappa TaxID=4217 RepID=A0ACB8ZY81_ARCLA|nr:hypothetical protein L6452_28412 [Arctium lappa]
MYGNLDSSNTTCLEKIVLSMEMSRQWLSRVAETVVPKRGVFIGDKISIGSGSIGGEWVEVTRAIVTTQDRAILEILQRETKRIEFNRCVIIDIEFTYKNKVNNGGKLGEEDEEDEDVELPPTRLEYLAPNLLKALEDFELGQPQLSGLRPVPVGFQKVVGLEQKLWDGM